MGSRRVTGILLSFHYHRDTDLDALPAGVPIFADSGAFSAATTGAVIDLADYMAWLRTWAHRITVASSLDVIGDPDATARNTARLLDAGFDVLPVFHYGSSLSLLEEICRRHRYVALGGMVGKRKEPPAVMRFMAACFQVAREHGTVFHGFGQTRVQPVATLPFYSIDSSSWNSTTRYGELKLWDGRAGRMRSMYAGNPIRSLEMGKLLRSYDLDPAWIAVPGFGLKQHRTPEEYRREAEALRRTAIRSWRNFGDWLVRRHAVIPPPGQHDLGTVLYLADFRDATTLDPVKAGITDPMTSARVP